jgi:hypothetical protein
MFPLLALLLALGPSAPQASSASRPLESGLIRSLEIESPPGTYVQHFRLDPGEGSGPPLGLARYVAGPDGQGTRVELELAWFEPELRLIQTERASAYGRLLVFREVRPGGGRTLFLTGDPGRPWSCHELGGPEPLRREFPVGGELPLLLLEAARRERVTGPLAPTFDPLRAGFEPARARLVQGTFELRTDDGGLRFAVDLDGDRLVGWRWQAGSPVARPVSPETWESLRREHEVPHVVPASTER